jgi:lipid-A-disaccharide synthase
MNLVISAAEPSGDLLGAELVTALKRQGPVQARGIAGPHMRAAGVEAVARTEDISVMGLVEVLGRLPAIRRAREALLHTLDDSVDAFIGIDSPDLHLPIGRAARSRNIVAIGYVSPQVWAWRPGRVRDISRSLDTLLCLFGFEPPLYGDFDARWVGHPVRDRFADTRRGTVEPHTYALLPGSREQERRRMLGPFIDAACRMREADPTARFLLVGPPPDDRDLPPWVSTVDTVGDVAHVRGALCKAGTVTLELAVMGIPMVVAHRVHPVTHALGRTLVRGIGHIAMPNILAKQTVVPEFVQDVVPDTLAEAVLALPEHQPVDLDELGPPGAAARAAEAVRETVDLR